MKVFLQTVRPAGLVNLVAIPPSGGATVGKTFDMPGEVDAAVAWATELNVNQGQNLYFSVNPIKHPVDKKPTKADILCVEWLHCDLDPNVQGAHQGDQDFNDLPLEVKQQCYQLARQQLLNSVQGLADSDLMVVDSGNGLGVFWRLSFPVDIEMGEDINRQMIARYDGDPSAFNADRLMRLPGTLNYPSKGKVARGYPNEAGVAKLLAPWNGRSFTAEAIAGVLPPLPERGPTGGASTACAAEVREILFTLQAAGMPYDDWRNVGMGLHDKFNGGDEGLCLWNEWSALDPDDYPGYRELEYKYLKSFSKKDGGITFNTVCDIAKAAGADLGEIARRHKGQNPLEVFHGGKLSKHGLPDLQITADGKAKVAQLTTLANLSWVMEQMGINSRFNMLRYEREFTRGDEKHLDVVMTDELTRLGINNTARFEGIWAVAAKENSYHPMADWLLSLPAWDGQDHIAHLASTVRTSTSMWPLYLKRWLIQTVEAARGWRKEIPRALPYMLILAGGQGTGKSTWFKNLFPTEGNFFLGEAELHLNTYDAKDHKIAAFAYAAVELSELDGMLRKSDTELLKGFLSRTVDTIRVPFGKAPVERLRNTVFCGTVNKNEHLTDPTGSRRYWPSAVEDIAWEHTVNMNQLWAHVNYLWQSGESYHLTEFEKDARRQEAHLFTQVDPYYEAVTSYFTDERMAYPARDWTPMSSVDVAKLLGLDVKYSKSLGNINRALTNLFGERRHRINGKQRSWLVPVTINEAKAMRIEVPLTPTLSEAT